MIVVVIVLIVLISTQSIFNLSGTEEESDDQIISTVLIERRDLRTFEKIDGVLEYGSEVQVLPGNNGILTYIISEGEDIYRGTVLFKYYKEVTELEFLTADNQIAAAESSVAQAEAALELLTSGPTDAQVAAANSAVAQAEAALELLTSDPTDAQVAAADSAVAQAEAALELLTSDPTDTQIAAADSTVAQAEATLVNSNAAVDTQWIAFRIARQDYCDLSGKLSSSVWTSEVYKSVCPDSESKMTEIASELLLDSIFDETQLVTSSNDLLIAYENHKKSLETEASSIKALDSAKAQRAALDDDPTVADLNNANKALESAKAQRAALDDDPTVADLNNANKALESAKTSLRLAKHTRDELVEGIEATIAMYGEQPAWRTFETGMAEGLDVFQLEQNLVALGYDETESIAIDHEFDEHTSTAIENMQSVLRLPITGKLEFREVLFIPGNSVVQYSEFHTEIGTSIVPTNPVLSLITIEKVISKPGAVDVTRSLQKVNTSIEVVNKDLVDLDLVVSIELPDENVISGTISDIGDIAVIPQGNQGEPYLEIVVSLEDTESYPEWTGASVTVSVTKKLASNVLAAPVTSLLAILGGGYAIEVIENGSSKLVPVSVGLYADGWVEINGEGINVGTEVVVP